MLTLAIIAKHSANGFQALVDSALPHVAEIVVAVDDDAEAGIEGYKGDVVRYFRRALAKNFAEQRNFLIAQARAEWVLHLDTDENLAPWMWEHLHAICETTSEDLIMLPRANRFVDDFDKLVGWPDWQPKLHRNSGVRFHLAVHEWPVNYGAKRYLPAEERFAIQHVKTREAQERANALYATICSN